jgi:hypothetical protein
MKMPMRAAGWRGAARDITFMRFARLREVAERHIATPPSAIRQRRYYAETIVHEPPKHPAPQTSTEETEKLAIIIIFHIYISSHFTFSSYILINWE